MDAGKLTRGGAESTYQYKEIKIGTSNSIAIYKSLLYLISDLDVTNN